MRLRTSLWTLVIVMAAMSLFFSSVYLEKSLTLTEEQTTGVESLKLKKNTKSTSQDNIIAVKNSTKPSIIPHPMNLTDKSISIEMRQELKQKSSVDYFACCGLGHRMSKMVDANYIARHRHLGLRIFWGFCNETTEIFHHFFGPQPWEELLESVFSTRHALKISNESPCFKRFHRTGNQTYCRCPANYMEESGKFYSSLMKRFRKQREVEDFMKRHEFDRHTVIGLHVRAGNGEEGDFQRKNRAIENMTDWIQSMSTILMEISNSWPERPPLLFIATDTASVVEDFRKELAGKMRVVDYEQERVDAGDGVVFGQQGAGKRLEGEECLLHWKNSLMDMIILAWTDVVVAGRPSSFTQSLPMGVVLARPNTKTTKSYCEISFDVTSYRCFEDFHDWCCRGESDFHLGGLRSYEFRRMPISSFVAECQLDDHIQERPLRETTRIVSKNIQQAQYAFLPYNWDWVPRSIKNTV